MLIWGNFSWDCDRLCSLPDPLPSHRSHRTHGTWPDHKNLGMEGPEGICSKLIKFKVDSVDVVYIQTLWGKEKKHKKTATDVPGQVPGERTCCWSDFKSQTRRLTPLTPQTSCRSQNQPDSLDHWKIERLPPLRNHPGPVLSQCSDLLRFTGSKLT